MELTINQKAFLDMIAISEIGRALLDASDNGYNVIVGSTFLKPDLFTDYSDHPRKLVHFTNGIPSSTAAGRYQIKQSIFDFYTKQLNLDRTFSKDNQDAIAMQLIKECHAIDLINNGKITSAILRCSSRWASFPGNQDQQHINNITDLIEAYTESGGILN